MTGRVGWLCWGELTINNTLHLRARDYQPGVGEFSKRDALTGIDGRPDVANPYTYGSNSPLNKVDPLGLSPSDDGTFNVQLVSYHAATPSTPAPAPTDPCTAMAGIGIPLSVCQQLLQLAHTDMTGLRGQVDQVDCDGGRHLDCNLIFTRTLTDTLALLDSVLDGLWNLSGDVKAHLNDGWTMALNVSTAVALKLFTEDDANKAVAVLSRGINHDPNEALKRVMCDQAGQQVVENIPKDKRYDVNEYLKSRGKKNWLNCYDLLDSVGANGFNLDQRLRPGFRGSDGSDYACVGIHILANVVGGNDGNDHWKPTIADMVWESYPCRR